MQTRTDQPSEESMTNVTVSSSQLSEPSSIIIPAYNGVDRNAWLFGWTPQQELWNGRLAMLGFIAYFIWDWKGYSVLRDVLHLIH